jgi:hypothetical protein
MRALARTAEAEIPPVDPAQLATPVLPVMCGLGGSGTLVLLPAHDLDSAAEVLEIAVGLGAPIHVLPSALARGVAAFVGARAPGAALLDPCTSERLLVTYAGGADTVIALDPADRWDRAALLSAAAGAAVISRSGGPAEALLGALAMAPGARIGRHTLVLSECAPERVLAGAPAVAA